MNFVNNILEYIRLENPIHYKKIKKFISTTEGFYSKKSNDFYSYYEKYLVNNGLDIKYALDCYLKMIKDINQETFIFYKTGKYSSSNFKEVNQRVYNNIEVMNYYLHGLIISQFLWKQHYESYLFFIKKISTLVAPKNYLEIGVGHGLLLSESINLFKDKTTFDALDISEVSINFSKNFINNDKINFIHYDVFHFNPSKKYDFISMGEVLEHVEDPQKLLMKVKTFLDRDGILFITTPTNAPTIDHIYLFRCIEEIRDLIEISGFQILHEKITPTEELPMDKLIKFKVSEHYSAFLKKIK